MSKKNRAKSKAKRFGEGSAKPIVSAATYGVGGNAFAQAIADPVSTVHSNKPELLVVDGYNVIHCTPRYEKARLRPFRRSVFQRRPRYGAHRPHQRRGGVCPGPLRGRDRV